MGNRHFKETHIHNLYDPDQTNCCLHNTAIAPDSNNSASWIFFDSKSTDLGWDFWDTRNVFPRTMLDEETPSATNSSVLVQYSIHKYRSFSENAIAMTLSRAIHNDKNILQSRQDPAAQRLGLTQAPPHAVELSQRPIARTTSTYPWHKRKSTSADE